MNGTPAPAPPADLEEALAWLYARTRGGGPRTSERARRLLAELGASAPALTTVVVGTNGKGSVTNMVAHGLTAAGHRAGRFLSPHVEEFGERVAVDGTPLRERTLTSFVQRAKELDAAWSHGEETRPAFFEWTLGLALSAFADAGATASVLEAGVGGLHDATRAVEPVALTVLTNVDLDHLDTLGGSLAAIARDKSGAFRAGVPVVAGVTQPEVATILREAAARAGAPLHLDPYALVPEAGRQGAGLHELFALPPRAEAALAPRAGLAGAPAHNANRRANARLAAAALRLLGAGEAAVEAGLGARALPARLERFVVPGPPGAAREDREVLVVLDGAHDPAAGARLARELPPGYVLLFGSLARKQGAEVLGTLAPRASHVVITEASHGEGATVTWPGSDFVAGAAAALDRALAVALEGEAHGAAPSSVGPARVVATGSLYLAGLVRPLLRARGRRLPDPWEALAAPQPGSGRLLDSAGNP